MASKYRMLRRETRKIQTPGGVTVTLVRVQRISDGAVGGWIEHARNLSQDGTCWVAGRAAVYGHAHVCAAAQVYGNAQVCGGAQVCGSARVYGSAHVSGSAHVYGSAQIYGSARVSGSARVYGGAAVGAGVRLTHCVQMSGGTIAGNIWLCGDLRIAASIGGLRIWPAPSDMDVDAPSAAISAEQSSPPKFGSVARTPRRARRT